VLWRRPALRGTMTLSPPLVWFLVIYFASLVAMLVTSFWTVNPLTNQIEHSWSTANFSQVFTSTYLNIIGRTVGLAALVTVTDAVLALPLAYYMARVASPKVRSALFAMTVLPLWASYLAKVYAFYVILQKGGALNWLTGNLGLGHPSILYSNTAVWLVMSYIWLPYMITPIFNALERIPDSYIEASADMGARGPRTLFSVILPLARPGIAAGSIFTFALTLGDFITPLLVGGTSSTLIGNVIYENTIGAGANPPFGAALALVPITVMIVYLFLMRLLGAFEDMG
ncbi:MAG TPA: ABC transporter permease, partial [Marmoricola sp.]|nr:ABC transporter permease [Marmoricola sp.]